MTSSNPPLYYFTNINFNTSFYNSTVDQNLYDSRYLLKNYADSATAIESFKAGVKCSNYDCVNVSDNITLGASTTNGSLTIGSLNTSSQLLINRPLTMNYAYNTYTNINQIGFYNTNSSGLLSMTSGSTISRDVGFTSGTYLINYSLELTISTASITATDTFYGLSSSTSTTNAVQTCYNYLHINTMVYNAGDNPIFSGCCVNQFTSGGIYYILGKITFTGTGTVQGNLIYKWVRIG